MHGTFATLNVLLIGLEDNVAIKSIIVKLLFLVARC